MPDCDITTKIGLGGLITIHGMALCKQHEILFANWPDNPPVTLCPVGRAMRALDDDKAKLQVCRDQIASRDEQLVKQNDRIAELEDAIRVIRGITPQPPGGEEAFKPDPVMGAQCDSCDGVKDHFILERGKVLQCVACDTLRKRDGLTQ